MNTLHTTPYRPSLPGNKKLSYLLRTKNAGIAVSNLNSGYVAILGAQNPM